MAIEFSKLCDSSFALTGKLEFNSIKEAERQAKTLINFQHEVTIDCANLTHCDSAGMALLVNWDKLAKHNKTKINYKNFTEQMLQLIHLMGLQSIFLGEAHGN